MYIQLHPHIKPPTASRAVPTGPPANIQTLCELSKPKRFRKTHLERSKQPTYDEKRHHQRLVIARRPPANMNRIMELAKPKVTARGKAKNPNHGWVREKDSNKEPKRAKPPAPLSTRTKSWLQSNAKPKRQVKRYSEYTFQRRKVRVNKPSERILALSAPRYTTVTLEDALHMAKEAQKDPRNKNGKGEIRNLLASQRMNSKVTEKEKV